jgi:hypothetical protein
MIDPERHLEKKKKKLRLGMVLDLGKLKFWGLGNHTCQDVRLKRLNEAKNIRTPIPDRIDGLNASESV